MQHFEFSKSQKVTSEKLVLSVLSVIIKRFDIFQSANN